MVQFLKMQKLTGKDAIAVLITKWKWFHSQPNGSGLEHRRDCAMCR
jgi:hypothetical protein